MNEKYNLQKVLNLIQEFGCITEEQLQMLFGCDKRDFKDILSSRTVSRKMNAYVHNTRVDMDYKMLAALDVLCKYKKRLQKFYLGNQPIYINFLANDLLYDIIVSDSDDQEGIVKGLNYKLYDFQYADKYIVLFKDKSMLEKMKMDKPYAYCTYFPIKIIEKV